MNKFFCLVLYCFSLSAFANPFLIDCPPIKNPSVEDYLFVQNKLRGLKISEYLEKIYPENPKIKF